MALSPEERKEAQREMFENNIKESIKETFKVASEIWFDERESENRWLSDKELKALEAIQTKLESQEKISQEDWQAIINNFFETIIRKARDSYHKRLFSEGATYDQIERAWTNIKLFLRMPAIGLEITDDESGGYNPAFHKLDKNCAELKEGGPVFVTKVGWGSEKAQVIPNANFYDWEKEMREKTMPKELTDVQKEKGLIKRFKGGYSPKQWYDLIAAAYKAKLEKEGRI